MNIEQPARTQWLCVNVFKFASKLHCMSVNNERFSPSRAELIQIQMNIFVTWDSITEHWYNFCHPLFYYGTDKIFVICYSATEHWETFVICYSTTEHWCNTQCTTIQFYSEEILKRKKSQSTFPSFQHSLYLILNSAYIHVLVIIYWHQRDTDTLTNCCCAVQTAWPAAEWGAGR